MAKKLLVGFTLIAAVTGFAGCSTVDDYSFKTPAAAAVEVDTAPAHDAAKVSATAQDVPTPDRPSATEQTTTPDRQTTTAPAKGTKTQQQAIKSAESYLALDSGWSRESLINQLVYGGFSPEDAAYAVDSLDIDYNEQAVFSANSYLALDGGWSRAQMLTQLDYEGFTKGQATYAVNQLGLTGPDSPESYPTYSTDTTVPGSSYTELPSPETDQPSDYPTYS